ncbi:YHYH domain-containing protein [Saezia sanguinis]
MKKLLTICVVLFSLGGIIGSTVAQAHSGRTDSNGCHMDRKTGTRHCH